MTNPNDGVPLTRRQLRELAAQATGESSAPAGQVPPPQSVQAQPAPPVQVPPAQPTAQPMRTRTAPHGYPQTSAALPQRPGTGTPVGRVSAPQGAEPARVPPAQPQAPVPSRRSLREQTSSHRVVIVPPTQTSGIRTIDETGALSAIRDLGSGRPPMSPRPEPVRPPSVAAPQAFSPARPASSAAQSAPLLREQAAREQASRDQAAREQASRPEGLQPAWAPASTSDKPAPALFRQRVTAPGFEPVAGLPGPGAAGALPSWAAIPTSSPAVGPLPVEDEADEDDDLDDDLDDDEPDHKYTWLHYLILVAVAFVLGLIIWKVALEDRGAAAPAESASSHGIVIDADLTPHDHDF